MAAYDKKNNNQNIIYHYAYRFYCGGERAMDLDEI